MTWRVSKPIKAGWYVVRGMGAPEVVYAGHDPRNHTPGDDVGLAGKVWRAGQEHPDRLSEYHHNCEWKLVRTGDAQ